MRLELGNKDIVPGLAVVNEYLDGHTPLRRDITTPRQRTPCTSPQKNAQLEAFFPNRMSRPLSITGGVASAIHGYDSVKVIVR